MNSTQTLFAAPMLALGLLAVVSASLHPRWPALHHFAAYLCLIVVSALLRRGLEQRGSQRGHSWAFAFILLAVAQLSVAEAVASACFAALVTYALQPSGARRPVRALSRAANLSLAAWLASLAHGATAAAAHSAGLALAVAVGVFALVLAVPVAIAECLTQKRPLADVAARLSLEFAPRFACGALVVAAMEFVRGRYGWPASLLVLPAAGVTYLSYRSYFGRMRDQKLHIEQMAGLHLRTIEILALAIEAKDRNTHDHLCRVRLYAEEFGRELHLDRDDMEALRAAALLHDIGKIAVPEHIINKPGKLTPEEFERLKVHPVLGAEILERVAFPYPVVPIVRGHHERWDGQGYPDGLQGEQIPIGARILTVVDCLDALATDRPYRRALSFADAVAHIRRLAGAQFDPGIVAVLERRYADFETMSRKSSSTLAPLNLNVTVSRGEKPGAGFERHASPEPSLRLAPSAEGRPEAPLDPHLLHRLSDPLGSSLSLDDSLRKFCARLKETLSFDAVAVFVRKQERLLPKFVLGQDESLFSSLEIPLGEGLSGWVAQNRRPIVNGNPSVEPGYCNDPSRYSSLRSALAVPLESAAREVVGVFVLYAAEADAFSSRDLAILRALAPAITRSIENAIRYHLAESQATTDFLTRAMNAHTFFPALDRTLLECNAAAQPASLILCDLNSFREINHAFGHIEGNRFLSQLADRFRDVIREGDILARLGGDEFALVLPGLDPITAEARMRDLRAAVRQTSLEIFNDMYLITASLGTASFPRDGVSGPELLKAADSHLGRVKGTRSVEEDLRGLPPLSLASR